MTQKPETRLAAIKLWLEEFTRFTQAAEEWFRQATSRFAVPSDDGCRMLATYLTMLSHRNRVRRHPPDKRKSSGTASASCAPLQPNASKSRNWFRSLYKVDRRARGSWNNEKFWLRSMRRTGISLPSFRHSLRSLVRGETQFVCLRRGRKRLGRRQTAGGHRARRTPTIRSAALWWRL